MNGIQTLLVIVVVALSLLLIVVGIQVFWVVVELRRAVKRLNGLLEDSILGGGLIRPDKLTSVLELFRRKKKMETHGEQV